MYAADPTRLASKRFTANGSITQKDMATFNRAIIGSAGVRLKIVQADSGNYKMAKNFFAMNESSGIGSLWRDDAFGTYEDTMIVPPGEEFEMECVDLQSSGTYRWIKKGMKRPPTVTKATPTLAWTTNTADVTSNYMWYSVINNGQAQGLFFHGRIVVSDGQDAAGVTIAFPAGLIPEKLALKVPIHMEVLVDATYTDAIGYVDLNSDTAETRAKIQHGASITYTDTKACDVLYSGFVPLAGWTAFTPKLTYGVGTATFAEVGYMMMLGERTYAMVMQTSTADSDAESAVTFVPPIIPQDIDCLTTVKALEIAGAGGATYSNPDPSFDMANATGASRAVTNKALTQATDGQAFAYAVAGIVPIRNWQAATLSVTYGTADPATNTGETMYYDGFENMVFVAGHITFDDGNGCTSVVSTGLPVPPRSDCGMIGMPCLQVQHTDTFTNPGCYLDSDDTDPDDRAIEFTDLTTFDDGEVGELQWCGFYFV